jgi:hypothetical protein
MGLEWGPFSLVSKTEELLGRKGIGYGLETENMAVGIRHTDHVAPSIRKNMTLTSPTTGGRSVGIVRSRTQSTELSLVYSTLFELLGYCTHTAVYPRPESR